MCKKIMGYIFMKEINIKNGKIIIRKVVKSEAPALIGLGSAKCRFTTLSKSFLVFPMYL